MAYIEPTINNQEITGIIPNNTVWPDFGVSAVNLEELEVQCDNLGFLAAAVLDTYGIVNEDLSGAGATGNLQDLDIKKMDATTVVNMSLLDKAANGGLDTFIEPVVNPEGEVEFRAVGNYDGQIDDIYYKVLTGSYTESPKAVMVTGGRPLPTVRDLEWKPIWGVDGPADIFFMDDMLDNCFKSNFSRKVTIPFTDPQLRNTGYNDGIDNLYEINDNNPWDRIIGYVTFIDPGEDATKDTTVKLANSTTVPIQIGVEAQDSDGPNLGNLQSLPVIPSNPELGEDECWKGAGIEASAADGVRVPIPDKMRYTNIRDIPKDKFIRVSDVYVIGVKLDLVWYGPNADGSQDEVPTIQNSKVTVSCDDTQTTALRLDEGRHYAVAYGEDTGGNLEPYIVFTKAVRSGDPFPYGKGQSFFWDIGCNYARQQGYTDRNQAYAGSILPYNKHQGFYVREIWVNIEIDSPCINIYDPNGASGDAEQGRAIKIARALRYYVAPIVLVEPPNPIAYAGPSTGGSADLVDQVPATDNDPLSTQDFDDRELEIYMDEMQGGGMSITWSFLDEDGVKNMANILYGYFQSDVIETTYTCGPDCNPILGGYGESGGIVNSIRFNYSDSGSYTVSVNEGPKIPSNLTAVDGGPSMKMSENLSATGRIIQVAGDNIHYKVRIDGYGERWAVNMSSTILRKNDVVQVTVHNNPIES